MPIGNTDLTIEATARVKPGWEGVKLGQARRPAVIKLLFGAFPDKVQAKMLTPVFLKRKAEGFPSLVVPHSLTF